MYCYIDELSVQLGLAGAGCIMGNMVVNHLFGTCINDLQHLNIHGDYAAKHETFFIATRQCDLFPTKNYNQPQHLFLYMAKLKYGKQVKYLGVLFNVSLKEDYITLS